MINYDYKGLMLTLAHYKKKVIEYEAKIAAYKELAAYEAALGKEEKNEGTSI